MVHKQKVSALNPDTNFVTSSTGMEASSSLSIAKLLPKVNRNSSSSQLDVSRTKASNRTVVVNSSFRGGYSPSTQPGLTYIDSPGFYGVGESFFTSNNLPTGDVVRNFFTFRLPRLKPGEKVISGRLRLTRFNSSRGNQVETFGLFDVSTPASVLDNIFGFGVNPSIYEDLGTGRMRWTFLPAR